MSQFKYTHISLEERIIIENRLNQGESIRSISLAINRNPSTVYRELNRNTKPNTNRTTRVNGSKYLSYDSRNYRGQAIVDTIRQSKLRYHQRVKLFERRSRHYTAKMANRTSQTRQSLAMRCQPVLDQVSHSEVRDYVFAKLKLRWSPEQISLRLALEGRSGVSHMTIYRFIYRWDRLNGSQKDNLTSHLRRRGKPRVRQCNKLFNKAREDEHSIHDRPAVVDNLSRYGDLEGDTIFGRNAKDRLLTHIDRLTGIVSIGLILGYDSGKIHKQTTKDINRIFGQQIHTITYDNGIEFSQWKQIKNSLNTDIYFADPYKSCQRGRNENTNGLIRDFYPKGTDFKKLTKRDILKVESLLNNRPRKRFNGLTPIEARELLQLGC